MPPPPLRPGVHAAPPPTARTTAAAHAPRTPRAPRAPRTNACAHPTTGGARNPSSCNEQQDRDIHSIQTEIAGVRSREKAPTGREILRRRSKPQCRGPRQQPAQTLRRMDRRARRRVKCAGPRAKMLTHLARATGVLSAASRRRGATASIWAGCYVLPARSNGAIRDSLRAARRMRWSSSHRTPRPGRFRRGSGSIRRDARQPWAFRNCRSAASASRASSCRPKRG